MNLQEIVEQIKNNNIQLIIVRGIPGSGKSTYANKLVKELGENAKQFEADFFFYELGNGTYAYDSSRLSDAHMDCFINTFTHMRQSPDNIAVVSNTFTQQWELDKYIEYAKLRNIKYLILRMKNYYGSIHGIPEDKLELFKRRFIDVEGEILVS